MEVIDGELKIGESVIIYQKLNDGSKVKIAEGYVCSNGIAITSVTCKWSYGTSDMFLNKYKIKMRNIIIEKFRVFL